MVDDVCSALARNSKQRNNYANNNTVLYLDSAAYESKMMAILKSATTLEFLLVLRVEWLITL